MKERILRMNLFFGLFVLTVSSILLNRQVAFMKNWYFCFAWWSFILILDSINFRIKGESPLFSSFRNFLFIAFVSIFIWLIFELFNLRLENWSYHGLPQNLVERWLGYFISFASVVPAMLELSSFFENILIWSCYPWARDRRPAHRSWRLWRKYL